MRDGTASAIMDYRLMHYLVLFCRLEIVLDMSAGNTKPQLEDIYSIRLKKHGDQFTTTYESTA